MTAVNTGKRPPGRPLRPPLTEEQIGAAALALIDERGWGKLTMASLAAALGVRAPSLYHHLSSQQDVVHLVRRQVVRKMAVPEIDEMPWEAAAIAWGTAYYLAFNQHPNAIQVLAMTPIEDEETFAMYEGLLRVLKRAGFRATPAIDMITGVENLAMGFAYEHNAADLMFAADKAERFGAPTFAGYVREQEASGYDASDAYVALLRRFVLMFLGEGDLQSGHRSAQQDPA